MKGLIFTVVVVGGAYFLLKYRQDKMKKECTDSGGTFTPKYILGGTCEQVIIT